jgi:signal transduction histidine kinase/DNA-binding response OmpR family regulator
MSATRDRDRGRGRFLLAPALAVMNRLKYPQKFVLISVLFALPLVLVMYLLISEINDRIEFTQKEIQGDTYLRPLRKLYEHVAQSRILAHDYASGQVAGRPELVRKQAEIEEDFVGLQAVERELGQTLRTTTRYQALGENWRFLRQKLLQLEPEDSEALHTQLLNDFRALSAHVGDTSNLILDPDLDSYYLMDTVLLKLPQSQELLAQARLFGRKSLIPGGTLTAEQQAEFIRLVGLLRSNAEETRNGMGIAFRNNPANNLRDSLQDALRQHLAETEALLRAIETEVIKAPTVRLSAADYDRLAQKGLEANFSLWDRTIKELDGLLQTRSDGFARKKYLVEALAALALTLVAYLWVAFYVGVMHTVGSLRDASERMLGGSMDYVLTLETRDELGQVATAFNNVATRLRVDWLQAQEESARARAAEALVQQQTAMVRLLQAVAVAANEAATPAAALQIGIDQVCSYTGWPVGHAFILADDGTGELIPSGIWHLDDAKRFASFRRVTEATRFAPGIGLPGRVLAGGRPAWIMDVSEETNFPRAEMATNLNVKGAFGFPILVGAKVVGVLEFFTPEPKEPDEDLLQAMAHIGTQLGRVFERQRAEDELHQARDLAQQANKAKSVFLATMSHEIRTPLNAVLAMASLLQDTRLTAQQKEFTRVIRTSGEALLGVINDILDFSKIEAGHLELEAEALDVRACVEASMDLIAVRGDEKGLELAYEMAPDVPGWIVGDVTRLRQVLINLLSNAVKFTEQGEIVVTVQSAPAGDSLHEITFAVRDTGVGIPADRMTRLFQSFSQVDVSTARKYGGTGLGLAISRRLVEKMGGQMWASSEPGKGSTFQFSIVAPGAASRAEQADRLAELRDPATKRLLIVDHHETNRRIVTQLTGAWGFQTRDTGSPLEALRWLEAGESFDVGILDVAMPEMDGVTLAGIIRQRHPLPKPPLVAFTSLTRRESLAGRVEFEAFVSKPLKPSHLLDVLVSLLAGQQIQRGEPVNRQEFDSTLGQRLPLRILVAEDEPVNQQIIRLMLGRMAYPADFADNGLEALGALERRQYDLIFMDMQMPEMDGLECTRQVVRRYPPGHRPKIVAVTANVTAENAQECMAAGMDDFLTKPVKALELRKCLEQWGRQLAARRPADSGPPAGHAATDREDAR